MAVTLELDKTKINESVRKNAIQSVRFLAPWFGLNSEEAVLTARTRKLKICLCDDSNITPIYIPYKEGPLIPLSYEPKTDRDDFTIGHELGHWYHDTINPRGYRETSGALIECIANYSGLIYLLRGNSIKNPRFNLSQLVRMDIDKANEQAEELKKFYTQIWLAVEDNWRNRKL